LIHLLVLLCVVLIAGGAEGAELTVKEIVRRFTQETLQVARFEGQFEMHYRIDLEYPAQRATGVAWVEYSFFADPPKYRLTGTTSPVESNGTQGETHHHVWNGRSEANLYQHPSSEEDHLTVSRGTPENDRARTNRFLMALGIPLNVKQREQAEHKYYWWVSDGVQESQGYALQPGSFTVDGQPCVVVRRGEKDVLWFHLGDKVTLVRRDTWEEKEAGVYREVHDYKDYQPNGLPKKVLITHYFPVPAFGNKSEISDVEHLSLQSFTLEKPSDGNFTLDLTKATQVLDINSLTVFAVGDQSGRPFNKMLRTARPYGDRLIVWISLCLLGAIGTVSGLWRRKQIKLALAEIRGRKGGGSKVNSREGTVIV